jgi:hypothetical protein
MTKEPKKPGTAWKTARGWASKDLKKQTLVQLIREVVEKELQTESKVSDEAKRQGLEYFGFGRYGKNGKVTHQADNDRLVPLERKAQPKLNPSDIYGSYEPRQVKTTPPREFNPSIPLAKVSPEYDDVKKLHGNPDIKKLRNSRLMGHGRPMVTATKDQYELAWTTGGYGETQTDYGIVFSTKNPTEYVAHVTSRTTPPPDGFDDSDYTEEIVHDDSQKGTGSVADAVRHLLKMQDAYDKKRYED